MLLSLDEFARFLLPRKTGSSFSAIVDLRDYFYDLNERVLSTPPRDLQGDDWGYLQRSLNYNGWAVEVVSFIEDHLESLGVALKDHLGILWKDSTLKVDLEVQMRLAVDKLHLRGHISSGYPFRKWFYQRDGLSAPLNELRLSNPTLIALARKHPNGRLGSLSVRLDTKAPGELSLHIALYAKSYGKYDDVFHSGHELFSSQYSSVTEFVKAVRELESQLPNLI